MDIFADEYQKKNSMYGSNGPFSAMCTPVDAMGAFVALDKKAPDNLERTEKNIQSRFHMEACCDTEKTDY